MNGTKAVIINQTDVISYKDGYKTTLEIYGESITDINDFQNMIDTFAELLQTFLTQLGGTVVELTNKPD